MSRSTVLAKWWARKLDSVEGRSDRRRTGGPHSDAGTNKEKNEVTLLYSCVMSFL